MIHTIFAWILDLMLMLFGVLFLTFCILSSYIYYFDTRIIKEYKSNWETGPILDIISTVTTCPQGYENFISNHFPGNILGCDCTTSSKLPYKGRLYETLCDSYQIANRCKIILESNNISLNTWKGTKLCVMRMNKNFWQLSQSNVNCSDGMKKCGIFDGFGNNLCMMPNEICPINDIIISNQADIIGYNKVKLSDGFSLYYTNKNVEGRIIVQVQARQEPVCVHPYEGELGENYYILNNDKGPGYCSTDINEKFIDTRFKILDTQQLNDFYEENYITKYINKLPNYPIPFSELKVSLYKINYIGWKKNCYKNNLYSPINLVSPQITVEFYSNKNYHLAIIAGAHFFFILISIFLFKIFFEKMNNSMQIVFAIDFINIIFLIIILVIAITIQKGTDKILFPLKSFIENKCGDPISNYIMNQSFEGIKNVKGYLVPVVILSIIELLYITAYYIFMIIIKKDRFR